MTKNHIRILPLHHANIIDYLAHKFASFLVDFHYLLEFLHIVGGELACAAASHEELVDELVLLFGGDVAVEQAEDGV